MSDTVNNSSRSQSPVILANNYTTATSRVSLPVRFGNPVNFASERPTALLSVELLGQLTYKLLSANKTLLSTIDYG